MRNKTLDALRGLAIGLMIVDHASVMLFADLEIGWNGRGLARLSEPLFAVLFGYFLVGRRRADVFSRGRDVLLAELVVLPVFYGVVGKLDILATFLLVIALYAALGRTLVWLVPIIFLVPWDPTVRLLDYGLIMVVAQVACGMMLRRRSGWLAAAMVSAAWFVLPGASYNVLLTLPSALLVGWGARQPGFGWRPLVVVGRRPLRWYAGHIPALAALGFVIGRLGGPTYVEFMVTFHYTHAPHWW